MTVFERFPSPWVPAGMVLGVALGKLAPGLVGAMPRALSSPPRVSSSWRVEVPVMLSICRFCVATRGWFETAAAAGVLGPVSSPET